MLRLHVSCAVVAEVVLKLNLVVHVVNSQLHLTGFQPNSVQPNNLLTFAAPTFYRLIQHMMHITAHGCGVWGVLPLQPATYVVFSLDCVDTYVLYTIHYVYVSHFNFSQLAAKSNCYPADMKWCGAHETVLDSCDL